MTFLVTGGCGFLGSNVAASLILNGERVVAFDNLSRFGAEENLAWLRSLGEVAFVKGDVRVVDDVEAMFRKTEIGCVFHLAGQVAMTTSLERPRDDFETNVIGSINVLESVRHFAPAATVVYSSSNKVYGDLEWLELTEQPLRYGPADGRNGIDETAPLDFRTPYGCSKGAADQYMLDYCRNYGLNTVVFRHSTIYGGRQHTTIDQGWVGWFCKQALIRRQYPQRPAFTINGTGKQVRDLLHVSDAVRCYLNAHKYIAETAGNAFNVGGGIANSMSLLELFADLECRLQLRLPYEQLPWRNSDQKFFVSDNTKAERALRWRPQTSKVAGIDEVLAMRTAEMGA